MQINQDIIYFHGDMSPALYVHWGFSGIYFCSHMLIKLTRLVMKIKSKNIAKRKHFCIKYKQDIVLTPVTASWCCSVHNVLGGAQGICICNTHRNYNLKLQFRSVG